VRELERLIERVVALARTNRIDLDDLPPQVRGQYGEVLAPALAASDSMRAWASRYARLVFERCGRNKRQASRLLNISYHTLDAYLRYGKAGSRPANKRVPAWAREEPSEPAVSLESPRS
jgi:DNA-binding NtrC family response regulator